MATKQQSGFAVLELLMGAVIVVLIGVVAYLGIQAYNKQPTSSTSTTTTTTTAAKTPAIDDAAAATMVGEFYKKYYGLLAANSITQVNMRAIVSQYGTKALVDTFDNATNIDPIQCAQNFPSTEPSVVAHSVSGNKAVVTVQEMWGEDNPQTLTVNVVNDGGLKVDSVICPAA